MKRKKGKEGRGREGSWEVSMYSWNHTFEICSLCIKIINVVKIKKMCYFQNRV